MLKFADVRSVVILSAAWLMVCASPQKAAAAAPPQSASVGQFVPTVAPVRFEVSSIRLHKPGTMTYGPGFTDDGLSLHGVRPWVLASFFGEQRIEGLPDWGRDEYDIQAKVADDDVAAWRQLTRAQKNLAVQALLEDRFKMKWHRETRQMPGYAMVVAKGGPKFKEATPGDMYDKGAKDLGGAPLLGSMMEIRRGVTVGQAMTMTQVAEFLSMPAQKPVLDKTGLTGKYDLMLKVDDQPRPQPPTVSGAAGAPVASEPEGPSIFTIVQEQLGLKLVPGATVPVEFLVVDHIERPSEN